MPEQVRHGLLLVCIAGTVFFTRLGATHLWDDDETYFAQTAREMMDRDDLVVPYFNGTLFTHKPPFMFWMMVGAYKVFGVTEFAARLPSAVFGIAVVLLTWRMGRIMFTPAVGFWAGLIVATSLNFVVISRAAACDSELTFFCTLPLYFLIRGTGVKRLLSDDATKSSVGWHEGQVSLNPSWGTYALFYLATGAAVMVKGPIGVLLPTSVVGLFLLVMKAPSGIDSTSAPSTSTVRRLLTWCRLTFAPGHVVRTIWSMRPITAVVAAALVAVPWYVAVGMKTEGAFLDGFFGVHNFGRFFKTMDNHSGPIFYYLIAICVGFFPWSVFLTPCCVQLVRRIREHHAWRPGDVLAACWIAVWVGFFSLATTKFPHYVIPAYPALALVMACFVEQWILRFDIYTTRFRRGAWLTLGASGVGLIIAGPIVSAFVLPGSGHLGLIGVPLVVGAIAGFRLTERGNVHGAVMGMALTAALFFIGLFGFAAVVVDRHQTSDQIADAIRRTAGTDNPPIATFNYFRPGLIFYTNDVIQQHQSVETLDEFFRTHPGQAFLLTAEDQLPALRDVLPEGFTPLDRRPWFLRTGRTLVLLGLDPALRTTVEATTISESVNR